MPPTSKNTRAAIVDAAEDLFYHQGFSATSYADIAKITGVGKGNIHYHFNSKNILLEKVVAHRIEGMTIMLDSWSQSCDTPYDCIVQFIDMVEKNAKSLARYGCPIGTLNDELGKNNVKLQETARKMFDLILRWLEARFQTIMSPKLAAENAEQIMARMQGASLIAHTYGDPEIIFRQAKIARIWLADICNTKN